MPYAIETYALTKQYGEQIAVKGLNLQVECGSVFGFLGPNGAGKTTSIMMLLGCVKPTSGVAKVLGTSPGNVEIRRRIGFLPEKFQFHDFLTATEFLDLHAKLLGMSFEERSKRIPEVLFRLGLGKRANSRIREFSKGMQQRLGLGQAILNSPDLVILDEPTSALDPLGRRDVRDLIQELKSQGKTVLLNSHLLSEIEMTCDQVAIIREGEVIVQGTIESLLKYQSIVEIEATNVTDEAIEKLKKLAGEVSISHEERVRLRVSLSDEGKVAEVAKVLVENGAQLYSLNPQKDTLESLFVRLVEG